MEKTNRLGFYLALFLTVFIPFREIISYFSVGAIKFLPDILIWSYASILVIKNRFRLHLQTYDFAFFSFIVFGFISTLINSTSLLAFGLQVRSIGTMYLFFYVLRCVNFEKKHYDIISKCLMAVVTVLILFAIVEFIGDKTVLFPDDWSESIIYASNFVRTYSMMNNPNTFAFFCFTVMLFVYYNNRMNQKIIHYVFYAAVILMILLSASRSTVIALGMFYIFILLKAIREKEFKGFVKMLSVVLASAILLICLNQIKAVVWNSNEGGMAIVDRFEEVQSDEIIDKSNTDGRLFMIKKGLQIFADHPVFGTGFGTYGSAGSRMVTPELYKEYDLAPNLYADNEYIKVIVETGILGVLMYAIFILSLFKSCFKDSYKMMAFIAFVFIGMFYNIFEIQSACLVVYIIFACIDKAVAEENKNVTVSKKNL
ncbi:MAG: O-antigen ligase family protein [Clostridia bacterium]|nr:O-antigen ligase family protein [Clostridia bacterium]